MWTVAFKFPLSTDQQLRVRVKLFHFKLSLNPFFDSGRSLVKKVIIPFLVGLKFKTSVMVPLAMALIALKTWKALTLGLLSLVLGGALFIFKLAKPKVVNYEVVHYPHHDHHHIDHHHVDHAHIDHAHAHHLQHGWGRQAADSQELAYSAFTQ